MKEYKFTMPIEVRASQSLSKTPEYIVRGIGAVPKNPETYYHSKDRKTGKLIEVKKSLFTENAIKSMERQAKTRKIFVDAQHRTGISINLSKYLDKYDIPKEEKEKMLQEIDMTDLPLAKVNEVKLDETGSLIWDLRLNPNYREVNPKYFDAVWGSLQEGYINGLSPTFAVTDVVSKDGIEWINDVELYGIEFTNGTSPETSIFEVSMRAAQDFTQNSEERKMQEELEKRQKELDERERNIKSKEEETRKAEEAAKKAEIQKEIDETKKLREDLQKELEASKKARETSGSKGLVPQEPTTPEPNPAKWNMEDVKFQQDLHETMSKRLRTSKNKDGDLTLAHLIALDHENVSPDSTKRWGDARNEESMKMLDTKARVSAFGRGADIHIPVQPRG